jgi:hypothetical protein
MQSRPIVYSIKEAYHVARRTTTCAMIECPFYAFLGPPPNIGMPLFTIVAKKKHHNTIRKIIRILRPI